MNRGTWWTTVGVWVHPMLPQSCPTLCNPVACSPPGSSVPGILQVRILEWVAVPSSRGSSRPRDGTHTSYVYLYWQVGSLQLASPGKPGLLSMGSQSVGQE